MSIADDMSERAGPVSDDEADQIARRYNASHFHNHRDMGERARYSIPADPRRDDDIRLGAYITQTRALRKLADDNGRRLARAVDLISEAGPLAWVANEDMDGAAAWERRASSFLAQHTAGAEPPAEDPRG